MEGRLNLRNEKIKLNKKDARENKIYIYFIIFFLGCIVGFTYETILGIFHLGGLYSKQGLLIGPFIPVYGTGAVLFTVFLKNMKSKFKIQGLDCANCAAELERVIQKKVDGFNCLI